MRKAGLRKSGPVMRQPVMRQPVPTRRPGYTFGDFMTLGQLAKKFGVKNKDVRTWLDCGMPSVRLTQRRQLVHEQSAARWLMSRQVAPPSSRKG